MHNEASQRFRGECGIASEKLCSQICREGCRSAGVVECCKWPLPDCKLMVRGQELKPVQKIGRSTAGWSPHVARFHNDVGFKWHLKRSRPSQGCRACRCQIAR